MASLANFTSGPTGPLKFEEYVMYFYGGPFSIWLETLKNSNVYLELRAVGALYGLG